MHNYGYRNKNLKDFSFCIVFDISYCFFFFFRNKQWLCSLRIRTFVFFFLTYSEGETSASICTFIQFLPLSMELSMSIFWWSTNAIYYYCDYGWAHRFMKESRLFTKTASDRQNSSLGKKKCGDFSFDFWGLNPSFWSWSDEFTT